MWTKFDERIFMFIAEAIGNKCATADIDLDLDKKIKEEHISQSLFMNTIASLFSFNRRPLLHTPHRQERINN